MPVNHQTRKKNAVSKLVTFDTAMLSLTLVYYCCSGCSGSQHSSFFGASGSSSEGLVWLPSSVSSENRTFLFAVSTTSVGTTIFALFPSASLMSASYFFSSKLYFYRHGQRRCIIWASWAKSTWLSSDITSFIRFMSNFFRILLTWLLIVASDTKRVLATSL